jgi:histidyl-tRNA synthetase
MSTSSPKIAAVKGMPDILPPITAAWQAVEAAARRVFLTYGYHEIRTPIVEPTELFRRGVGESTAIVEKEMYTFEDKGGSSLTLRPEGTASVVRAYIESGTCFAEPIARYYYLGPMFRRERPQKGRQRQFHQIGCELLGVTSPLADAEVIAMIDHFLGEAGVAEVSLELNSIGCAACRPAFNEALTAYFRSHESQLCADCARRLVRNPLRLLDCKNEGCAALVAQAPQIPDFWCADCAQHFGAVQQALRSMGVRFELNPRIVRGLDYYMRTAFEFTTTKLGAQNAVAAGGRYDGLVASLGGPEIAGVGCAIGVERLVLLREQAEAAAEDLVFVATLGEKAQEAALPIIQRLRRDGVRVEWDYTARSLKAQMRRADKLAAESVVILGDDELARGEATVRNMRTKEQRAVRLADLPMLFVLADD